MSAKVLRKKNDRYNRILWFENGFPLNMLKHIDSVVWVGARLESYHNRDNLISLTTSKPFLMKIAPE